MMQAQALRLFGPLWPIRIELVHKSFLTCGPYVCILAT
jgi:hypothetical protein